MKTTLVVLAIILAVILILNFTRKKKPANNEQTDITNVNYVLENDPSSVEDFKKLFSSFGLSKHWDIFKNYLRPQIILETKKTSEDNLSIGQSKIGGKPDLPKNIEWFKEGNDKPLSFIGQINLEEIQEFNSESQLPTKGILYFFYSASQEAWGFDPKDKDKFKVFYSEQQNNLERKEFPSSLEADARFSPTQLTFKNSFSLPSWENEIVSETLNDEEVDSYGEIIAETEINKMLGYADNIQGEMELECQLVTNGLYCGDQTGYNDPKRKELEKGSENWKLLFQVDSEMDKTGMMWGDSGRLYFWITEQDLKEKNFDNCWFILQCY
jgi:uncharacterized protein YwqG